MAIDASSTAGAPAWLRRFGTSAWYLVGLGLAVWGVAEMAQKLTVALLPVLVALLLAGVLEAAQAANVRLIHLASAAEYGRTPEGEASREDGPAQPLSPYGASKLAGTVLLQEAVRTGRADALALRLTNPVGAGMNPGSLPGRWL